MRKSILIALSIFIICPAIAQKESTIKSEKYLQWKNKSPFGITVAYDHKKYDNNYSISSHYGYLPSRGNFFDPPYTPEPGSFEGLSSLFAGEYKIEKNTTETVRLQIDYWLFPFLNIYAIGGKIYDHCKMNVILNVKNTLFPAFTTDINTDGWIYGCGTKGEFIYNGFKPSIEYSIYWNDLDGISEKSLFQQLDLQLGYMILVHKPWIKNINIYTGGSYNHINFKHTYDALYDLLTLNQIFDAIQESPEPLGGVLHQMIPENIHDWNLITGVELELFYNIHCKFEATFLGKQTSLSAGITYRLFGKK